MVALSLGTRETYPKYYDYKDLAAIRGPYANAYFLALNKAEEDLDESVQGKLKDKKIHIGLACIRIFLMNSRLDYRRIRLPNSAS